MENQYINLAKKIISEGKKTPTRFGTNTLSLFGETLNIDLSEGFPLLTTKFVSFKCLAEELLWFISGNTNTKKLAEKGIHIWDANSTREFLDKNGFKNYKEGDIGPMYGFQWRHFGAKYIDCDTDYKGQGIDQIQYVIDMLRSKSDSREIVLSAWNAVDISKMILPPCHVSIQFKRYDNKLSALVFQRSADVALGLPFNIASYALLVNIIAKIVDCVPDKLIFTLGDAHVYENHIIMLKQQINYNMQHKLPTLVIKDKKDIDAYTYNDFEIKNYKHSGKLKFDLVY
jgi:thymidylate synthase